MNILIFVTVEIIHLGWLVYGNVLYYSKEAGQCMNSSFLINFIMFAIIMVGYFHFIVYIGIIVIVVAVCFMRARQHRQSMSTSVMVLRGLVKTKFS